MVSKSLKTSSTSKEVGVEQAAVEPPATIVETCKPWLKRIGNKVEGSQDIVGYDDRNLKKACFIKETILGSDLGRRPEVEFEVFPIKIR